MTRYEKYCKLRDSKNLKDAFLMSVLGISRSTQILRGKDWYGNSLSSYPWAVLYWMDYRHYSDSLQARPILRVNKNPAPAPTGSRTRHTLNGTSLHKDIIPFSGHEASGIRTPDNLIKSQGV